MSTFSKPSEPTLDLLGIMLLKYLIFFLMYHDRMVLLQIFHARARPAALGLGRRRVPLRRGRRRRRGRARGHGARRARPARAGVLLQLKTHL